MFCWFYSKEYVKTDRLYGATYRKAVILAFSYRLQNTHILNANLTVTA